MSSIDPEVLADLVAECLSRRADGEGEIPFDEICADHPELKQAVKESVEKADRIPGMHASGPGADRMIQTLLMGRYRVQERVGSGAMGVVYAANDLELGRKVAVKVMHSRLMGRHTAIARFDREASALAAVKHSAVVTIHDRGVTEDGSPFLVMELIDGASCSTILEHAARRAVNDDATWMEPTLGISVATNSSFLRHAVRWAADVADGLHAAHSAGVYHRDVKPSNIIVRPDGSAVLLDFGIAATDSQSSITRTDVAVGTPAYMAPETLRGAQKARPSQDVYGLAATLYHLLTFKAPYQGSATEVLRAVATRDPAPAIKVRPGLPRDAQAILDHGLARNPSSRYPDAASMESDLRALLAHQPVSVRPTSTVVRLARRLGRSKVLVGAALATLVIFGALGVNARGDYLANKRMEAWRVATEGIPGNYPVGMGTFRGVADPELRRLAESAFDGLVESGYDPLKGHALRALFRLDHGDSAGAAEDIRAARAVAPSTYMRALTSRYADLPRGEAAPIPVDLEGLPEPSNEDDVYVATLHALRSGAKETLLDDPRLDGIRRMESHRLRLELEEAVNLRKSEQRLERNYRAEVVYRKARHLLESSGYGDATLQHLMAASRAVQLRDGECLELSKALLAKAPASPATLQTAGDCARKLGLFDEARSLLERGLTVTPDYPKMEIALALTEAESGRFARAREIAEAAHFAGKYEGFRRMELRARVEAICVYLQRRSDPEAAKVSAQRLAEMCDALTDKWSGTATYRDLVAGVLEGDDLRLFRSISSLLKKSPDSVRLIDVLIHVLPESLEAEDTARLGDWIRALMSKLNDEIAQPPPASTPK